MDRPHPILMHMHTQDDELPLSYLAWPRERQARGLLPPVRGELAGVGDQPGPGLILHHLLLLALSTHGRHEPPQQGVDGQGLAVSRLLPRQTGPQAGHVGGGRRQAEGLVQRRLEARQRQATRRALCGIYVAPWPGDGSGNVRITSAKQ